MHSRWLLGCGALALLSAACAKGGGFLPGGDGGAGTSGAAPGSGGASVSSSVSATTGTGGAATSSGSTSSSGGGGSNGTGGSCPTPCKLTEPQCGCAANQECTVKTNVPVCAAKG